MYKTGVIWISVILLSGCGVSSTGQTDADNGTGAYVTGAIVPTSADDGLSQQPKSLQRESHTSTKGKASKTNLQEEEKALVSANTPGSTYYKIGPQDVLDISVFKVAELSRTVQVSEEGSINIPLVGEVTAAGKTPREVERELKKRFGTRYLQNPQVSVFVKEYNSQRVTIEGAVKKSGVYPVQGGMSLLQAVALAGGMDDSSSDTILIFRNINGKRSAARFDISDIKNGTARDPRLQAGDVIVVDTSTLKKGFGNVMKLLPLASVFAAL
jgi:polysaccharide export outer membrane protein